jgi:branched-chain amino acid transport system substrate-binding protein
MAEVAEAYRMVTIQPVNNARKLYTSGWEYQFLAPCSEGLADLHNYEPVIKILGSLPQDQKPKTLALLNTADVYPRSVADGIPPLCEKYGINLVFHEEVEKGVTDVSGVVTRIKNINPDVLVVVGFLPEETLVIKTCRELDFNPKALCAAISIQSLPVDFVKTLGETANYVIGPAFYDVRLPFKSNVEFVNAYRKEYGEDPQFIAAGGYAAAQLLEAAIIGTSQYKNQDLLRDYLLKHEIETVFGTWKVDQNLAAKGIKYIALTQVYAAEILNGKVELIFPPEVATAQLVYPKPPW